MLLQWVIQASNGHTEEQCLLHLKYLFSITSSSSSYISFKHLFISKNDSSPLPYTEIEKQYIGHEPWYCIPFMPTCQIIGGVHDIYPLFIATYIFFASIWYCRFNRNLYFRKLADILFFSVAHFVNCSKVASVRCASVVSQLLCINSHRSHSVRFSSTSFLRACSVTATSSYCLSAAMSQR